MEADLDKQGTEYIFKMKEQKHLISELQLKLKHSEHRLLQKDEYY